MADKKKAESAGRTTLGIVGAGRGGNEILKLLSGIQSVRIVYISDINRDAVAMPTARSMKIMTSTNIAFTVKNNPVDFIINTTGVAQVQEIIRNAMAGTTEIVTGKTALFFFNVLDESRRRINALVKSDVEGIHQEIVDETKRIDDSLVNINEITSGMKMLAFNAGVEAARAGKDGQGFTVVAEEIKNMSERTKNLASGINEINKSIAELSGRIQKSLEKLD